MEILKLIFDNAATNFLLLLIVKAMIIFFQIFKNFEFKRPYTYNGYQLGLEFMIMMILLYADKVELVSKELNHFGGIVLFFRDWALQCTGDTDRWQINLCQCPQCPISGKQHDPPKVI